MFNAIITATLSFIVFTFGSLLVALQVASGQLTPRIIATVLVREQCSQVHDRSLHFYPAVLDKRTQQDAGECFSTCRFCRRLPWNSLHRGISLLIDYAARLLRPISIVGLVGKAGLTVIESVYPDPSLGPRQSDSQRFKLGTPARTIEYRGTSEIVLATNITELVAEAEKSDGVIEFVPQVGDFIATDEPLFNLYGGTASLDDGDLMSTVAFGPERTLEQDPTFAFRIIVDIALKALSPAINDPTTAVIAIDQLHRLLRKAGNKNLRTDEILNKSGQLVVIFELRIGKTLCISHSLKYGNAAYKICKLLDDCEQ